MIDKETGWYATPASVKAILRTPDDHVVLLRNNRDEWELPGGWPDETDVSLEAGLRREVHEELGVAVDDPQLTDATLFEPIPGRRVALLIFTCSTDMTAFRLSNEHTAVLLADPRALPTELPSQYADAIRDAFDKPQ